MNATAHPYRLRAPEQWLTSDNQTWTVWREANDHEIFLQLRARCDYLLRCSIGPDAFAKALLSTESLTIGLSRAVPRNKVSATRDEPLGLWSSQKGAR